MDKDEYYKILNKFTEEWIESCIIVSNCTNGLTKKGKPIPYDRPAPENGYPVIIKWRDVVKDCEWCGDRVVNQKFSITLKEGRTVKKCDTCGMKQTDLKREKKSP